LFVLRIAHLRGKGLPQSFFFLFLEKMKRSREIPREGSELRVSKVTEDIKNKLDEFHQGKTLIGLPFYSFLFSFFTIVTQLIFQHLLGF
jgi:hypothetical protein